MSNDKNKMLLINLNNTVTVSSLHTHDNFMQILTTVDDILWICIIPSLPRVSSTRVTVNFSIRLVTPKIFKSVFYRSDS